MISHRLKIQALIVIVLGAFGLFSPLGPAAGGETSSTHVCDCHVCLYSIICPDINGRDDYCEDANCFPFACGGCIEPDDDPCPTSFIHQIDCWPY